jgi:hypothetical protein
MAAVVSSNFTPVSHAPWTRHGLDVVDDRSRRRMVAPPRSALDAV